MGIVGEDSRMMRIVTCLAVVLAICPSARAESVRSVLNGFGLVGTWLENCARDIASGANGERWTFSAPYFGKSEFVLHKRQPDGRQSVAMEITEARRVTEDKVMIVLNMDEVKGVRMVFQKVAQKIRLFEVFPIAGSTQTQVQNGMVGNYREPFLERCMN
jgi:hypothetical protein